MEQILSPENIVDLASEVRAKTARKIINERLTTALNNLSTKTDFGFFRDPGTEFWEGANKKFEHEIGVALNELNKSIEKSKKDNDSEKAIQKIFSICLFIVGLAVIGFGIWQNQLTIAAAGAVPELLVVWPYNNIRKISNETTFLNILVPSIKTHFATCRSIGAPRQVFGCYKEALKILDDWLGQLSKSAYG